MNFLQLCQMASRESGVISGTQPSSVLNQTGLLANVVAWTADAVEWVENEETAWRWMQKSWTGSLTAGNRTYTAASFSLDDFAEWICDKPRDCYYPTTLYLTATGVADEQIIRFLPYKTWQQMYDRGTQTTDRPVWYTISPANEIIFAQSPNDAFTARGMYRRAPNRPTANAHTPGWPSRFHAAAGWEAARRLAAFDKAWDEARRCEAERDDIMFQLRRDQLPEIKVTSRPVA